MVHKHSVLIDMLLRKHTNTHTLWSAYKPFINAGIQPDTGYKFTKHSTLMHVWLLKTAASYSAPFMLEKALFPRAPICV